jgi:hypothetical protein
MTCVNVYKISNAHIVSVERKHNDQTETACVTAEEICRAVLDGLGLIGSDEEMRLTIDKIMDPF